MTRFRLPLGKFFVWDGEQFYCEAHYTAPRLPELMQLIEMLRKSDAYDPAALAEYVESVHGKAGLKLISKERHALD